METDRIIFLGTAGARIMVSKQLLASGGAWMELAGQKIVVDPGPGSLVQAIKRKLDPSKLAAIVLSHKHLDHSGDINIMIEAMTQGGYTKRGVVFAPADALEGDPVILRYLRYFPEHIETLTEGKTYTIGDVRMETPLCHVHPVDTYGLIFQTPKHTFSWIVDSRFFEGLKTAYRGELLIINIVRLEPHDYIDHLSVRDAEEIISSIRPKLTVLTHFGMTMWQAKPWEVAAGMSAHTGVKVIAARDGMVLDLDNLSPDSQD
ncbi:MAG: MBL fold metallo-hydrolase [Dehalococcoidia bacterium]|nr:MBL fold metallo-hydrolase [Dehalococcoidia bacterium]